MVARKHNEHRPFEIEQTRNKSRYGEAVTADSTVLESMDDPDHTPLYYLLTMKQYVSVDTWICTMKMTYM